MIRLRAFPLVFALCVLAGCGGLAEHDPALYPEPKADHITFWGHGCVYIDVDGIGIVTDPVFDEFLINRDRFIGAPPDTALARTRVVLISHAHNDHTSDASLATLPEGTVVLGPEPVAEFLEGKGLDVRAMKAGDEHRIGDVRLVPVTVHHPGGRMEFRARSDGRAFGWVIITPRTTIFYSGDTDYCSAFSDVGSTYAPDIAILNVNGHLKPPDAARAARDLRAPIVIPAHWGAYGYVLLGGNRRPRGEDELKRLIGDRLRVLNVGESFPLDGRDAAP